MILHLPRNVGYMKFCGQVAKFRFHFPLRNIFAQNFNIDKDVIAGIEFSVLAGIISSATSIPNHGDTWFKGMELSRDVYKMFLKPNVRETFEHVIPFTSS